MSGPGATPPGPLLRLAGALLVVGLLVSASYLFWPTPITITLFFLAGGVPIAAGMLLYLVQVVRDLRQGGLL